ncbi:MAG: TonB-dependent receptor [Bacteroidales bacterium]
MKFVFITIFSLLLFPIHGQTVIKGKITDKNNAPLAGVNVYFEGTYDGATTDENGNFQFLTALKGEQIFMASYIGFKTFEQNIQLSEKEITLDINLKESSNRLDAVVITAGAFEASDEKKTVTFKPLDIVTTAGGLADIPSAINTLPGTQMVGEEGKLFVRGGDSYETQTYIDGMIVDKPYESTMPDVPARGQFSPFMFKGTIFSSGGYSAEFGQALSSALILQTTDMPAESVTSLSFMSVGLGASHTKKWDKTALSLSADYLNLQPYFAIIHQNFDWNKAPQGLGTTLSLRQKFNKDGLIKVYGQFGTSSSKLVYPGYLDVDRTNLVSMKDEDTYINATFMDLQGKKLISKGGLSYTYNKNNFNVSGENFIEKMNNFQARYSLTYLINEDIQLKIGGDIWGRNHDLSFTPVSISEPYESSFSDNIASGFVETEFKISRKFAARVGGRVEYSDYLKSSNVAPRASLAYKTGKNSQVSLAYGTFYQSPEVNYLLFTSSLEFEQANHYILNYQYVKNRRTFRIEGYYKKYHNLVKFDSLYIPDPARYNNQGTGYAKGIDVFWRDNSFANIDYWISYSYLDSERDYQDFVQKATPTFVSNHNLSIVYKHYVSKISSQFGFTYKFASGRPYYNPSNPDFLSDRTKTYNDLSFNISYLTSIKDNFTIVYFSLGNVLGFDQTFGYRYSLQPDNSGNFSEYEIKPGAKRFLFLGIFISI